MNLQEIQLALGNGHLDRVKMRLGEPRDGGGCPRGSQDHGARAQLLNEMAHGGTLVVVKPDGSTRELYLTGGRQGAA